MTEDTRDIAMTAKTLIDHHMLDCTQFRENLRGDFKEFREDIKKLYFRVAMILGGLMLAAHSVDWIATYLGHK